MRRQSEAAQAQVYASEQGRRGVILSLVTSVATSYIALARARPAARDRARHGEELWRHRSASSSCASRAASCRRSSCAQVESQYQQALAAIPSLELQVAAQENLLSVLLGRNPGPIPRGKTIDELVAPGIPGDLPSALLERRPDILQAEQSLRGGELRTSAWRSRFTFRRCRSPALLGSVSTALGDFLTGPGDRGQRRRGPERARSSRSAGSAGRWTRPRRRSARRSWSTSRSILTALRETNDALVGSVKKREEAEAQAKRVAALRDYARLSRLRFDNGYAGYLEVLYAENELFSAELTAVRAQAERYTQIVNVYQALGGGWVDEASKLAPQPLLGR